MPKAACALLSTNVSVLSLGVALVALGAAGAGLVGCSGADKESTFDPTLAKEQAADPTPPGPLVAESTSGDGGPSTTAGPTSCDPKIPATFAPAWNAPRKAGACESTELSEYYGACLTNLGDTATAETCKAWRDAHPACTTCLEPSDRSGPIQWALDRKLVTLNIAGCISLVQGEGAADGCAAAYDKTLQCTRQSCDWCIEQGGAYATYQACQKSALATGVCQSLEGARQTKCAGITGASGTAKTCFPAQGETELVHYVRVEGIFCGK
jgi:hypothetical protein